jgi:putative tricarboxylic transport membrane protein
MVDAAFTALMVLLQFDHLKVLMAGVVVGLSVGIIPGIGGVVGMSILLPVVAGMDPTKAFALLIGMVATIPCSDTFPSVLMGIPGSSSSQATILDGYPLAKKGQAARALSAAFTCSLFGGLLGALILSLIFPLARPIVLAFGSPELFMLAFLGVSMVGVLSGDKPLKGLLAAGAGLMLGTIGAAPAAPEYRYVFDILYLFDGVPLVVVALGFFAIPEIIDLLIQDSPIAERTDLGTGWWQGVRDCFEHKWIVIRCAIIGVFVGATPGLGGSVVDWIAYGHVLQTSRDKSKFGNGDIRGVIAPESANNAKEGGGLIPTLLFGVPGSGSMAIFLGGLLLIGVQPGPSMFTETPELIFTAVWSLALGNVFGAIICIGLARYVSKLTTISFTKLAPFIVLIIVMSTYQASYSWGDMLFLMIIGIIAWLMKFYAWPRPAALIGFVLSAVLENYLFISIQRFGYTWVTRKGVLILALVIVFSVFAGAFFKRISKPV